MTWQTVSRKGGGKKGHQEGLTPPREATQPDSQRSADTRRRIRGKSQPLTPLNTPPLACPASPAPTQDSQSSEDRPEPYGCWDEIYEVMRKPVLVDRHIPRELKTLWQRLVMSLLTAEQSRTDVYPIASDLVFILPKLVLSHPPGKEKARDRLQRIQQCLQQASQGEWKHLTNRVLDMTVPRYEQDESQPLVTGADSLPPRTAKRLYKAASQGQLGKAWRQLRATPSIRGPGPMGRGCSQAYSPCHTRRSCPSPKGHCTRKMAPLLPGSMSMPFPDSKRTKQQMRVGGLQKQLRAA